MPATIIAGERVDLIDNDNAKVLEQTDSCPCALIPASLQETLASSAGSQAAPLGNAVFSDALISPCQIPERRPTRSQ